MNIKQKENESSKKFVTRFEHAETELKNVGIKLPQIALAIHILQKSNLTEMSQENIVMKSDTDNHEEIFRSVSKCMKEIKVLTVTKDEKREDFKTFFTEKHQEDLLFFSVMLIHCLCLLGKQLFLIYLNHL